MNYKLSIIVCTYKREELLRICLDSLKNQTLSKKDFEIIVVNNNKKSLSLNLMTEYLNYSINIRFVDEPDLGLRNARNSGWKESSVSPPK